MGHNDHCRGTVTHLRRIACSDGPACLKSGLELSESFHRGVAPRAFINVEAELAASRAPTFDHHLMNGQCSDFILEPSSVDGGERTPVAPEREGILIFTTDPKFGSDILSSKPHAQICLGICFDERRVRSYLMPAHRNHAHRFGSAR